MEGIETSPLTWPEGWKRTPPGKRKSSRYQVSFSKARGDVLRSLSLMGVPDHNVVLSSNIPSKSNGLPYATYAEPTDPGIACYWTTKEHERRVIACDSWRTVRENLRAVGLALEALRQLERTGASEILNRAFTGFAALPGHVKEDWRDILDLHGTVNWTKDHIEERYRQLSRSTHPDAGGSHDAMVRLNAAREAALRFLRIG